MESEESGKMWQASFFERLTLVIFSSQSENWKLQARAPIGALAIGAGQTLLNQLRIKTP